MSILRNVTLMVRAGASVGVLGTNGANKSTLIKTLAKELPLHAGERRASRGLAIGYFHQHQLDMLDLDSTPLQHLTRLALDAREQELRNYLDGFGFSGDTANARSAPCPAAKRPAWPCHSSCDKSPICCLIEPSNHLDVETREALAAALAEFSSSMLLVSHDRHLLRTTIDSFWICIGRPSQGVRRRPGGLP